MCPTCRPQTHSGTGPASWPWPAWHPPLQKFKQQSLLLFSPFSSANDALSSGLLSCTQHDMGGMENCSNILGCAHKKDADHVHNKRRITCVQGKKFLLGTRGIAGIDASSHHVLGPVTGYPITCQAPYLHSFLDARHRSRSHLDSRARDIKIPTCRVLLVAAHGGEDGIAVEQQTQAFAHGLGARGAVEAACAGRCRHAAVQPQPPLRHLLLRLCLATWRCIYTLKLEGILTCLKPRNIHAWAVESLTP